MTDNTAKLDLCIQKLHTSLASMARLSIFVNCEYLKKSDASDKLYNTCGINAGSSIDSDLYYTYT